MALKVFINPQFNEPDRGEGGIRRVVEAQVQHLPAFGVDVVQSEADADVVAVHAGSYVHTNKPFVAHNHGLYWTPEYEWGPYAHDLNKSVINCLRRCDVATAPSDWVGYIIKRGMNIPAQTVYHGVNVEDWVGGDKSQPYVLWNKTRVDVICDPAPVNKVAAMLPNVRFVTTYGDAAPNVTVTGRLPHAQAAALVRGASVYLATSRETFGIGTLEAMAAGAAIAGWDWGGQSEIITHGVNGLLCQPEDYGTLAELVREALARREALADNARETASEFTWERACEQYASVYLHAYEARPRKRVSVVITCYNLAHVLPRAVASVDDPDAEIVVVNDASPDTTESVAASLADADNRVRVVTNPGNLYLAGSLDAGIRHATGRYIVPLDADNELAPGALSTLAASLDSDPDVDVAYGSMELVKPNGERFISGWPSEFVYEQQMAHRNQVPSTSMYRRKWWERAGGYRRRCRTAEDADFWCRITSLGAQPKKVTARPTLIYHDRDDSMSHVERDWPWEAWYTWSRVPELTPFGAPVPGRRRVPTYQPPFVSVVIPVGPGHAKYLPDALDSLVAQTYQNWRCIVVDDRPGGTLDRSGLGLTPWVEPVLAFKGNQAGGSGPAHARNVGLARVKTPYVLFLDADDYLAPDALEVMLRAAQERDWPKNEWFYSDWYKQEEAKVYKAPDFNTEHFRTHLTHSVTAMYPTSLLRSVKGFDENLDAWEDWDMCLKMIEAGACGVHLPFPLFYYRYHAGQRREQLYAGRERHTEVMKAKWRKYMVENEPMPCGCSGGGNTTTYSPAVRTDRGPIPVSKDGRTLVQFVGASAPRTYRGPSGREYRFGSDDGHKMHYVNNEDLPMFLNRIGFELTQGNADGMVVLEAAGPPDREMEFAEPPAMATAGAT